MNPRRLTPRDHELIERYSYCQLGMTPQTFYGKWGVSQEAIASICSRSLSTVRCCPTPIGLLWQRSDRPLTFNVGATG